MIYERYRICSELSESMFGKACSDAFGLKACSEEVCLGILSEGSNSLSIWALLPQPFPGSSCSECVRTMFGLCSDIVRMNSTKSMSMKEHAYILNTPDETHAWVCFDWVWIKLSWAELWRASRVAIWACSGKHVRSMFGHVRRVQYVRMQQYRTSTCSEHVRERYRTCSDTKFIEMWFVHLLKLTVVSLSRVCHYASDPMELQHVFVFCCFRTDGIIDRTIRVLHLV